MGANDQKQDGGARGIDEQSLALAIVNAQALAEEAARPEAFDASKICPEVKLDTCERVWVRFFSTSGDEGNSDVVLNLNGLVIRCKRNVDVDIPKVFLDSVVNLAVTQQMDSKTQQMTPVMRYPYALIGPANPRVGDPKE